MLRTALRPRWLGLFAVMVLFALTCWRLGLWQLHVAQDKGAASPTTTAAAQPLTAVLSPHQPFPADGSGRLVTMVGTYAAERQVLVAGRRLDGVDGLWVVDPFTVTPSAGKAGPAGVIAVVRGFVRTASEAPPPPTGTVSVEGALAPGESPASGEPPAGQLGSLDLSVLVNQWPGDLYNAFAFATAERAAGAPVALGALQRVPPPSATAGGGLQWRNAAYALQWWIFALFAGWMWFKMVRDDWLTSQAVPAVTREEALAEQEKDTSDATP